MEFSDMDARDKVIDQARKLLALRDDLGKLQRTVEVASALQALSVYIQHLDAEQDDDELKLPANSVF
jgi:hypothetical protein